MAKWIIIFQVLHTKTQMDFAIQQILRHLLLRVQMKKRQQKKQGRGIAAASHVSRHNQSNLQIWEDAGIQI